MLLLATVLLLVLRAIGLAIEIYVYILNLRMQLFGLSSLCVEVGFDMYMLDLLYINVQSVVSRGLALVLLVLLP